MGREVLVVYSYFLRSPYALIVVKPRGEVFKAWYTLKREILYLFLVGVVAIFLVVFKLTDVLVRRMREFA